MKIDTEKIVQYVEDQRKKYDCPNYGQNYLDAVKALEHCVRLFIEEDK